MEKSYKLIKDDAVSFLKSIESMSVDCVITDPPYESLEKYRAIGTTTRLKKSKASSNEWFDIFPNSRFEELFTEIYRVLKKNSHFYMFCDVETMFFSKPIAEKIGFKFWKQIIWDKVNIGMGYHYRSRYECILFFEKGKRKISNLSIADIITEPRVLNGYPTEKPVAVSEVLVKQSTLPGEIIVDPFTGSSSVGIAAIRNGRIFHGADTCAEAIEASEVRLAASMAAYQARIDQENLQLTFKI
jgi:site-specific DNA-methyltransferase (adenine-specific)